MAEGVKPTKHRSSRDEGALGRRAGRTLCLVAFCFVLAGISAAPARAASGWWTLGMGARPAALDPGTATDAVQQASVSATSGQFSLERGESVNAHVELAFDASAATVQSGLEGLYGTGNVQVAEGAGDTASFHSWAITFAGELADQPIAPIQPHSGTLAGGTHEASDMVISPGRADGQIVLTAENVGVAGIEGAPDPIQIAATLPPAMTAVGISATAPALGTASERVAIPCARESLTCTYTGKVAPYGQLEVRIDVLAAATASSAEAAGISISGGGAPPTATSRPLAVGLGSAFGVEDYEMLVEEEAGQPATQAGSHPFQLTTTVALNQQADGRPLTERPEADPVALTKDVNIRLPTGLLGNPRGLPRCTLSQFFTFVEGGLGVGDACADRTAVGVASVTINEPENLKGIATITEPVFDLEPGAGEPARFGIYVPLARLPLILDASLRGGASEDYGLTLSSLNTPEAAGLIASTITLWGTPADPRHDEVRGWGCLQRARGETTGFPCAPSPEIQPSAFLTLPTSCSPPPASSVLVDSWAQPGNTLAFPTGLPMPGLNGCAQLSFAPTIAALPTSEAASSPTGLNVDLDVNDEGLLAPTGTAQSQTKQVVVALPEGVAVNPSLAAGLGACSQAQYRSETIDSRSGTGCPPESEVGEAEMSSPLLEGALTGNVYIARQNENPFGSLLAVYVVLKSPETGVLVRLAGKLEQGLATGRLTAVFDGLPQLPLSHLHLSFRQGQRSAFATPPACGAYTTRAELYPYSEPEAPRPQATSFQIATGAGGGPCPAGGVLPFGPSLAAGTTGNQAGAFSPLSATVSREDGTQPLGSFQLSLPPGLGGLLAGFRPCPEAQANEGTCTADSQIGETTVTAGVGSSPVVVPGGRVYLTEKYAGAPFGLSIVSPTKVGPFDLEHDTANPGAQPVCDCFVVRARVEVGPRTAQLTIATDTSGSHAVPRMIDGIPLQIKKLNILLNRPRFTFNPTNCKPLSLGGTIRSAEAAAWPVSDHFQAINCATLKFAPKLAVSTSSKTSIANGARLTVKVSYPGAPQGTFANVAKVKVALPKQLPSRFKTLQRACTSRQFEANPAGCPPASFIGHAVLHTPVLPVPLAGPAIFVSRGGEAFPSLVLVLQGYGVTVDLVGATFISKAGITSIAFKTVPDVPFDTFELTLPQGKFSALAANLPSKAHGSFCGQKLAMPSEFVGQNGAVSRQSVAVRATGCAKGPLTRAQKLAAALGACKRMNGSKRVACAKQAHARYGSKGESKKRK